MTVYGGRHADDYFSAIEGVCNIPEKDKCVVSAAEAEMVKLFLNGFAAVKAVFASELARFAAGTGIDWEKVVPVLERDPRVGRGYLSAAGADGLPGVGGHCLPKDARMLIAQLGGGSLLEAGMRVNSTLRGESNS
jgi:UDP-glucose 6-dehydrogenase